MLQKVSGDDTVSKNKNFWSGTKCSMKVVNMSKMNHVDSSRTYIINIQL